MYCDRTSPLVKDDSLHDTTKSFRIEVESPKRSRDALGGPAECRAGVVPAGLLLARCALGPL